jgi:hypothetical protein
LIDFVRTIVRIVGGCGRQRLGALVLAPHHGADGQAAPLQRLHDEAAHAANPARGARDKNGVRHRIPVRFCQVVY